MESVLGRYRNLIILVGVLFLQILGLAVQVKKAETDTENTRLIRIWAVQAVTPLERGLVRIESGFGNLWHNYIYLRGVRAENRDLKDKIEQLKLEQVRLSEDAAQAHRLQAMLSFKEQFVAKTVAAQVIGSSGSDLSQGIYIDKGDDAGIRPDMAVITADGIVGKVLRVYPSTTLVLLINDQSSGVGVMLGKTRLQGILKGTPTGEVALENVMSDEEVPVGETVLTSGGDKVFPKGLPVGTIAKVKGHGDRATFLEIRVRPSANLSKLEEVLVVLEKQEQQSLAQESAHQRAADILAQRLPSVPEKPPVEASGSAASTGSKQAAAAPGGAIATGNSVKPAPSSAATKPQLSKPAPATGQTSASQQPKPDVAKTIAPKPSAPKTAIVSDGGAITEVPSKKPTTPPATKAVPQTVPEPQPSIPPSTTNDSPQ
ncbi:MAG TPA: rod shape-determining protein MreC [Candidatus Sulfotelmatobacter sp.]|nr:rod shape-determining protein MreC [Candidatus Sulfotelmatobacter sp.]